MFIILLLFLSIIIIQGNDSNKEEIGLNLDAILKTNQKSQNFHHLNKNSDVKTLNSNLNVLKDVENINNLFPNVEKRRHFDIPDASYKPILTESTGSNTNLFNFKNENPLKSTIFNKNKPPKSYSSRSQKDIKTNTKEISNSCELDPEKIEEIKSYQADVDAIIELFLNGAFKGKPFELLANITDEFGPRMTGTEALENSIDWIVEKANDEGLVAYTENVTAPYWIRGDESLTMKLPRTQKMKVLGLGKTVGTPKEGIRADAIVVKSFDELRALGEEKVKGRIVVYNQDYISYPESVEYRVRGADEASQLGALAVLVRSVTDFSIQTTHTGSLEYESGAPPIPGASISVEDAKMLQRIQERGHRIVLELNLDDEMIGDTLTRNTIIELPGTTNPEEVVLVSGHLDSWDVGYGSMDDAGGCVISWMVSQAMQRLQLKARRTVRAVFFTAEEQGIFGGKAYYDAHIHEKEKFQIMMESDSGVFEPQGLGFDGTCEGHLIIEEILKLTHKLGTMKITGPSDGPDFLYFLGSTIPLGSFSDDLERYFWFHHTEGDRLETYKPEYLDRSSAFWASVAYVAAQISFRIPQLPEITN